MDKITEQYNNAINSLWDKTLEELEDPNLYSDLLNPNSDDPSIKNLVAHLRKSIDQAIQIALTSKQEKTGMIKYLKNYENGLFHYSECGREFNFTPNLWLEFKRSGETSLTNYIAKFEGEKADNRDKNKKDTYV